MGLRLYRFQSETLYVELLTPEFTVWLQDVPLSSYFQKLNIARGKSSEHAPPQKIEAVNA